MAYAIDANDLAIVTIWQEARGESYAGKLAVAQVIRNRMLKQYQSDGTVAGTVLRPYQFSGWNTEDGSRVSSALVDRDKDGYIHCKEAWFESSSTLYPLFPAVLFHSTHMDKFPYWAKAETVDHLMTIGNHAFYTDEAAE